MNLDSVQIRHYFAPPAKSYWRWQDGCSTAIWEDGRTITFREELELVLATLMRHGLPPLGSVLLLLSACRDSWEEHPVRRTVLHAHLGLLYGANYADLLTEVLTGLGKVHGVRTRLRARPANLAELAARIFDGVPGCYSHGHSNELVARFREGLTEEEIEWKPQSALDDFLHDLGCLRWGLRRFNPAELELALETGLDDVPQPAPLESPPATARSLIGDLADDPELGAVARLARLLLAAVQLPRSLSDPDELPIGGVSDIVNRGPLDRLLLSELANDNLSLSVRVAMNEALYLRRESPPRTPPRERRVLLDAGLRTWGVPRVFIAAVGLALAAKSDPQREVRVFRSERDEAAQVDFHSRAGLRAHLAALDHQLHPAAALSDLAGNGDEADLILVTTADTLTRPEFQRAMYTAGLASMYIAAIDRSGRFQLIARTGRGSKVVSEARFDLDEVMKPRSHSPKLLEPSRDTRLPAIFAERPFPLRLSCQLDKERSWLVHPATVVSFTRDGRLLLWDDPQRGALQLIDGLPEGALLWCASAWEGDTLRLVIGKKSQRGLRGLVYSRQTGHYNLATLQLSGQQPVSVIGRGDYAFVHHASTYDVVRISTGDLLQTSHRPAGMSPRSLCLPFRHRTTGIYSTWATPTYQPDQPPDAIALRSVFQETDKMSLIGMCEPVGCEGPVGITTQGGVLDPATGIIRSYRGQPLSAALQRIQPPFTFQAVSRDGRRVRLGCMPAIGGVHISEIELDVVSGQLSAIHGRPDWGLERPIPSIAHSKTMRNYFSAIGALPNGELVLTGRRGHWGKIAFEHRDGTLRLRPFEEGGSSAANTPRLRASFVSWDSGDRGYKLSIAEFADGSRAWLDSRGLLHLVSSDQKIPECSLVLTDGPLAGWLSDGRVFGPDYWLEGKDPKRASVIYRECLLRFGANLR